MTVGGTVAARYTYDPLDRRIGIQDNGIQTWVVWDGQQPYADFNGSGALQERYLYGPAVDEILARTDSVGTTSWYLTDRAGSIRNLADSSGTVTGTISYDGFGKQLGSSGAVDRFGYTGREYDPTTGLQYNRERYYDAALGRWTQEDKSGFAGEDANLERYVGNSPTNASDPNGLIDTGVLSDYWGYFQENGPRAQGVVQGITNFGAGLIDEFSPSTLWRQTGDFFSGKGLAEDRRKAAQLFSDPQAYLAERERVIGNAIADQLSTPEGQGEAFGYIAASLVTAKAASLATAKVAKCVPVPNNSGPNIVAPNNPSRGVPDPTTPVGRRGSPLGSVQGNAPTTIGGRQYSGHAIDQMQARGVPPSVAENTIQHGVPGRPQPVGSGTTSHFDSVNNITVITDTASGRVVTVFPGR